MACREERRFVTTGALPTASRASRARAKPPRSSRSARRFGGNMYLVMFLQFADRFHRQEIVTSVCGHVGSGVQFEADVALGVLDDLVSPATTAGLSTAQADLDFDAQRTAQRRERLGALRGPGRRA